MRGLILLLAALSVPGLAADPKPPDIPFVKKTLDLGANEAAAIFDVNKDGKLDIVSGENWYEAPNWTKHRFRDLHFENNYIDDFSDLALDVDLDGWTDLVMPTWFSKEIAWFRNPGKSGVKWEKQVVVSGYNVEFAFLFDMDNDGKAREVLPQFGGAKSPTAWYEYKDGKWVERRVSDKGHGHGIGAGDLNGDGRADVLTPQGWYEAPPDPRSGAWTWHADWNFKEHLSFMHVHDVDGDKVPDIVTANAHDYGLFWLRKKADGTWEKRDIDKFWSQVHALHLVDLNGDGKLDILTGKRFLAHDFDPGARDPNGIYWYETVPAPRGGVQWVRHIIDYSTAAGAGMQLPAADIDGDGDLDFVAPGKSGLYLFENLTKSKGVPRAGTVRR